MNIIISLIVGLCAAVYMHHITYNANARSNILGYGQATWKLVIVTFVGVTALTYGIIAL